MGSIFLVGFMACGKTTVGPLLAARLGLPFTDLDHLIESRTLSTIAEIIGRDGDRIPFTELSQGTVGLVYLCLRAGLVDEMRAAGGVELPVVMDDVLTHLDPERRAGGARVIADLATRHQVLYFTCHDEQVAALAAASPGYVDWPLERLV